MHRHSVLVVDDHASFRSALCRLISASSGLTIAGQTGDCHEAIRLADTHRPDLILLNASLTGATGPCIARVLRRQDHGARTVFLSLELTQTRVIEAMRAGAHGYLCKVADAGSLVDAIERVLAGENLFVEMIRMSPGLAARLRAEFPADTTSGDRLGTDERRPLSAAEAAILDQIAFRHAEPLLDDTLVRDPVLNVALGRIVRTLGNNDRLESAAVSAHHGWMDGGVPSSPPGGFTAGSL